ncbi:MAG: pantetheine-phosphate adenylyltransferase, partial [Flavicella sp.]
AITNRKLAGIETVFLLTSAETSFISSSIVRDILRNNGDATNFVPQGIL